MNHNTSNQHLLEIQDQLERAVDTLSVKLLMVAMSSLLKKVVNLGVRVRKPEYLTREVQTFVLGQHTPAQRKIVSTDADRYSTVIGREVAPSLADHNLLAASDEVSLVATSLQARG